MGELRAAYRDRICTLLGELVAEQESALDAARDTVAEALAADRLIFVAGSGHSHLLAEEIFYRAGGIAATQPILPEALMLHLGAYQSTQIEREEGRAAAVLEDYCIAPGDVVFIASNSGRNAYPIEIAILARQAGAKTIAITALEQSRSLPSRHSSGQRLFEVCDIVLDNRGSHGDASLEIPGRTVKMGPTSTIAGAFLLNTVMAEAVGTLAERGIVPDIFESANTGEGDGDGANTMIEKWRRRIRHL